MRVFGSVSSPEPGYLVSIAAAPPLPPFSLSLQYARTPRLVHIMGMGGGKKIRWPQETESQSRSHPGFLNKSAIDQSATSGLSGP